MRRMLGTLRWDVIRQYRSGFYGVSAILIPLGVALLRWIGAGQEAAAIVPPMLVMLALITTFYFAGAILLLERGEGTLAGLVVSPLRPGEYLAARVGSLALLAIGESLIIVLLGLGLVVNPLALLPGLLLVCAIYTLLGTAAISRYDTINEYLLPSALFVTLLMLPMLQYAGIWPSPLFYLHPIQPGIVLMRAAVEPVGLPALLYGVLAGVAWTGASFALARRSFQRFVARSSGT
jgi:fluoroquinolone transport system permease protein